MWDPPRPGIEPVSPALVGRFATTEPPGGGPHAYTKKFTAVFLNLKFNSTSSFFFFFSWKPSYRREGVVIREEGLSGDTSPPL